MMRTRSFLKGLVALALAPIYAPGCGQPTYVAGTNGGQMPCGANLTILGKTEQYLCGHCRPSP